MSMSIRLPSFIASPVTCYLFLVTCSAAATFTWDGGGADNNWQTAANWVDDAAPPADGSAALVFVGGSATTAPNDFPAGTAFAGITLNNTAAFTLSGNAITLTGPLTAQARATAITDTLSLPIALGAEVTFTHNNLHHITYTGVISGDYGLTKRGSGEATFNGPSTYTGKTDLDGGRVYYNSLKNLGEASSFGAPTTPDAGTLVINCITDYKGGDTTSDRNLFFAGGGLQFYNSGTGTLTLNGGIGGPGGPSFRGARNIVVNGPVTNAGAVGRTDTGTVYLNFPSNTFPGGLTLSDGTFVIATLADSGQVCSIGTGNQLTFGQTGWTTTGRLRYDGATDAHCNRSIRINSAALSHGAQFENATAGTTVTFSGPVTTAVGSTAPSASAIPLWLTGAGDGVLASNLPVGLRVIKQGAGTWTLSGANVYTGETSVTAGALLVNGSVAAVRPVSVAANATLGGTGTVYGAVSAAAGAVIAPGGPGATGTLTVASAELNGARLEFDLQDPAAGPSDRLGVTGALASSGITPVKLNLPEGGVPPGTYTLATYASRSGMFALAEEYPDMLLSVGETALTLAVYAPGTVTELTWTGAASFVWDTAADNWSPAGALYADGLNVIFDDSGNASSPILIPSLVAPNTVTVNTTNNAYTLTAGLSGNAMLAKRGPAALTLEGAHTHAGATIVEDGTLHLAGSLAASSVTIGKDAVLQQAAGSVIAGVEVSLTVQGKAWLCGANTYGGETVAGVAGQYDHDTTVCHNLALGSTAGGTTVVGGHAQYHNRVILASGVTVTGERLTLSAGGRVALAYTNDSGSATWDGDIVTAPGSLAYLNSNRSGGTLIVGAPGTGATITGAADIQFREAGAIVCNSRIDMPGLSVIRNNNGVLRLNSTNNVMRQFQIAEGTLRLGADNQLPADVILSMGKGDANTGNKAYLDLNGHSLTIGGFVETHYDAFTGGDIGRQWVTSALPATFIVGGSATNTFNKRNSTFHGAVAVVQAGSGVLELGQTNFTSGAFVVSNGVLRLNAAGSVGPLCTAVEVAGGTLELQNAAALTPAVNVTFPAGSAGKIGIPAGVNVPAATLWFGATQKRAGTWGAAGSGARYVDDTRFTGGGTLTVLHDRGGTVLTVM